MKRLANEQGANEFLFSCVNCFLGVMEFFNKHFNKWAFVQVCGTAIYSSFQS
jgi:hypothetical protein